MKKIMTKTDMKQTTGGMSYNAPKFFRTGVDHTNGGDLPSDMVIWA